MNEEDLQIENILQNHEKKKKVNGKDKGDRTERNLCKLFERHFGVGFSKAPGSGARTSQVANLPEHARLAMTGDLCIPEGFKWVIECKGGYEEDVNLNIVLDGKGIAKLDDFIEQSGKDAKYCGRKPLICWKRNHKPWLAMLRAKDLNKEPDFMLKYQDWRMVKLEELLENTQRSFWFE